MENMGVISNFNSDKEYLEAVADLEQAQQNFSYAEQNSVDAAIFGVKAAEEKINSLRRKYNRSIQPEIMKSQVGLTAHGRRMFV